jgi:hypothetical protein
MERRKRVATVGLVLLLCATAVGTFAQDENFIPQDIQRSAATAADQVLTFIDSVAKYLGQGVVYILNLIVGKDPNTGEGRVSTTLQQPIGYLAFITLILVLFGLLDFARRIIWIGIIVGWALLIVRVVLDALNV